MKKRRTLILTLSALLCVFCVFFAYLIHAPRQAQLDHALIAAIKRNDIPSALSLLKQGADSNARDTGDKPPSFQQALADMGDRILYRSDSANRANPPTALILFLKLHIPYAYYDIPPPLSPSEHAAFIQALLEHGAKPDIQIEGQALPLVLAARSWRPESVRILLNHGCNPNDSKRDGLCPLAAAAGAGDLVTTRLLLDHGAEVNSGDSDLVKPLMCAVRSGKVALVRLLLEQGANPNGTHALSTASARGNEQMIQLLLSYFAKDDGQPSVYYAIAGEDPDEEPVHHIEIARMLLAYGCSANTEGPVDHQTALFPANAEETQLLVNNGANPNVESSRKVTPLIMAAYYGDVEKARWLLGAGANPNYKSPYGTPLDIAAGRYNAIRRRDPAMIARLRWRGAKTSEELDHDAKG